MLTIVSYVGLLMALSILQSWPAAMPLASIQMTVFGVGVSFICVLCEQLCHARAGAERCTRAETRQCLSQQRLLAAL